MNEAAADAMNPQKGRAYAAAGASGVGVSPTPMADAGVGRPTRAVFAAVAGRPDAHAATSRDAALDTLRAFVTVLVVAHHSVIAYALISPAAAPRSPLHPWLAGIPIVDSHRLARLRPVRALQRHLLHVADVLALGAVRRAEPGAQRRRKLPAGPRATSGGAVRRGGAHGAARLLSRLSGVGRQSRRAHILARMAVARDLAERPAVVRRGAARVRRHRGCAVRTRS